MCAAVSARAGRPGVMAPICWRRAAHRQVASTGANHGAETIAGGTAVAAAVAALPRMRRWRVAHDRAVSREPGGKRPVILGHPDRRLHVEPRMGPGQHSRRLIRVEALETHEKPRIAIGRPNLHGDALPDFAECHDAEIENQPRWQNASGIGALEVQLRGADPPNTARIRRVVSPCRLALDPQRIAAAVPLTRSDPRE